MPSPREYSCIICVTFSWETESPKDCEILLCIAFQGIKHHPVYKGINPSSPTPCICCHTSDPVPATVLRRHRPTLDLQWVIVHTAANWGAEYRNPEMQGNPSLSFNRINQLSRLLLIVTISHEYVLIL